MAGRRDDHEPETATTSRAGTQSSRASATPYPRLCFWTARSSLWTPTACRTSPPSGSAARARRIPRPAYASWPSTCSSLRGHEADGPGGSRRQTPRLGLSTRGALDGVDEDEALLAAHLRAARLASSVGAAWRSRLCRARPPLVGWNRGVRSRGVWLWKRPCRGAATPDARRSVRIADTRARLDGGRPSPR
jgi:hypothetical protein